MTSLRIGAVGTATHAGHKRRQNEDAYVVRPPLFAIADGMGGARAGEIASALAASALNDAEDVGGGEDRLKQLVQEANRRVHERASNDPSTSGMGTTMTVALVEPDGDITFGHVGDSRAYVLRGGALEQLTDDHSLVAELVRRGELSPRDAEVHPQRSVITRALGTDPDVDVDAFTVRPQAGDLYLLCSDGLSDMVTADVIEEILRRHRDDLDTAAKALVRAALRSGGDDNITAVLFEIVGDEAPAAAAEPDERTREYATEPDEEDTLHPEDRVPAVTAPAPAPSAVDTMVVPAAELRAAAGQHDAEAGEEATHEAGIVRRLVALLVIVALIAVIVVLVWWGLAR
ncbi:MAG TPA: Stp1/IreP family PP2C-type Ser/Thr phosphatase [Gaiellaceae bacterium]|nr:Stp1/IreP family PP2C-type Ser/Thr phosphatase [Gaiellaceae bacterium]